MQGATEQYKLDQAAMKDRISACALVSSKARLEPEISMHLRKKAVVDMPEARAHHVGAVLGAALFIHGGQSGEGNKTLSDWNSFDFGLQVWMKCSVKEVLPDESTQKFTYPRKYHTMTAAIDPALCTGRELTRLVWVTPLSEIMRKPKAIEQGFYIFGGIDEEGA